MKKAILLIYTWLSIHGITENVLALPLDTIDLAAENMCLHQRHNGGWSKTFNGKSIAYNRQFTEKETQLAEKQRTDNDATIDNNATTREITYLLGAYQKTNNARYINAAKRGVDYLLEAQYPNGGWPQYYPDARLYRSQVTYNDNAMINVLHILDGIAQGEGDFSLLTKAYGQRAEQAVQKGIQCILASQVVINGQKTIWAAQYDKDTLEPATARSYELPSLATSESANILLFLMSMDRPSEAIKQSIHHGVYWFEAHAIEGYEITLIADTTQPTGKDRVLIESPGSKVWARFYDLLQQQPLFAGRDGTPRQQLEQIENERRVGYAWYGNWGDKVIREYKNWSENER